MEFNATDNDGIWDGVYSPQPPSEELQAKASELRQKQQKLKEEKERIDAQRRIGEIDKQINEIDEQLTSIYSGMEFNATDNDGIWDGVYSPQPPSEELQAKASELQQKLQELKKEKERINSQISSKKDKKEENTPVIGIKKISFSLLDGEGKYNPKYTAEYTNGTQQEAKPTKHKTKREERKAKRELKKSIKNVFKSFGIKISRTELRKMMNHIDVDLLDALSVYDATNDNKTSFGLEYVKAVKDKLNGGKGELPFELSYNTRTSDAENVDRKQASQYNKLAKRMDKIGLGECQTEPSFLEKIFGSKNEMIADKSRMTIDEQIAWYNGSKGEKEFDENLYWSNLREAGYSDEELAQIKAGLEPTVAQKYRESKHVPKEQLQPMPEKNEDSDKNRDKGKDKNENNEIEND